MKHSRQYLIERKNVLNRRTLAAMVLTFCLLLPGCSQIKFAYAQVTTLAGWYAGSYVTLDTDQKSAMRAALTEIMDWHCAEELPRYALLLGDIIDAVERGTINAAVIEAWGQQVDMAWSRLAQQLIPPTIAIVMSFSEEQISELERNLSEKLEESRAEYAGREYSPRQRNKRVEKNLRRWLGPLNDVQRERVIEWESQSRPLLSSWLESREHWNSLFLQTLRSAGAERSEALFNLMATPETVRLPEHRAQGAQWRAGFVHMLEDIYRQSDERQRKHASGELRDWQIDFEELSCAAGPKPDRATEDA